VSERKSVLLRLDPAVHDAPGPGGPVTSCAAPTPRIEFPAAPARSPTPGRLPGHTRPMRPPRAATLGTSCCWGGHRCWAVTACGRRPPTCGSSAPAAWPGSGRQFCTRTTPGSTKSRPSKEAGELLQASGPVGDSTRRLVLPQGFLQGLTRIDAVVDGQVAPGGQAVQQPGHDRPGLGIVGDVAQHSHQCQRDGLAQIQASSQPRAKTWPGSPRSASHVMGRALGGCWSAAPGRAPSTSGSLSMYTTRACGAARLRNLMSVVRGRQARLRRPGIAASPHRRRGSGRPAPRNERSARAMSTICGKMAAELVAGAAVDLVVVRPAQPVNSRSGPSSARSCRSSLRPAHRRANSGS